MFQVRRPALEIAAVVLTGAAFLVFENILERKLQFLIPCTVLWTGYLVWRLVRDRSDLRAWGLRVDNLRPAAVASLAFFAVAALGLLAWRVFRGWRPLPASSIVVFALYPVWGFIQQFVVQGLVAGNLRKLGARPAVVVPVAAVLFGLAHLPDLPLACLCAAAGVVWTILFLRTPNLIPLAFTHAWLGTLAYYWVLERDPWREMFP